MRTVTVGADSDFGTERTRTIAEDAALWRRFKGTSGEDAKVTALQKIKLAPAAPAHFKPLFSRLAPANEADAQALLAGVWRIGTERMVLTAGAPPWAVALPSKHFADRLHGFHWLGDVLAGPSTGVQRAGLLLDDWNHAFGKFNGFAWRLEPLAWRCWNQMVHGAQLFADATETARRTRLESLWKQLRFLADGMESQQEPQTRWIGAVALAGAAMTLRSGQSLAEALERVSAEVTAQILPDGGHVSRSPSRLLEALIHLLTLRDGLKAMEQALPDWMDKWISRMGSMVAFFQLGDGALAPFNDGSEADRGTVSAALERIEGIRRFSVAPKSGFQKLDKQGLRLILDCGEAPPRPFGEGAHAGALSFELADGDARLVTSCGFSAELNVDWQAAVRRTGAHSTLNLAGRDSATFVMNEESRRLATQGPEGISAKRLEEADDIWLEAQHGGYKSPYGLLHRRRLFVSKEGAELKGEDSLARPVAQAPTDERKPIPFEIRFHLHPSVTAMMGRDAIRLICDNGAVWRFRTSHEGARLERTVYLARGRVERPEQIVLSGFADPNSDGNTPPNCIRWAFHREAAA